MTDVPAFSVRSYPAFRFARLHRVYIDKDALYLIRMPGVIGHADAAARFQLDPGQALTGMLIRYWAKKSLEAKARRLESSEPSELLGDHRSNRRVDSRDVVESRLDPPRLLGHGEHFACWSLQLRDRKRFRFQIEDETSLKVALEHLPKLLGTTLTVSVTADKPRASDWFGTIPPPRPGI